MSHSSPSAPGLAGSGSDLIAGSLRAGRLGIPEVVAFAGSSTTPLTVVSGVVPVAFVTTGVKGIPLAFAVVGVVLAVFTVGFAAMSRYIENAGAFYAYVAQGFSRRLAVGVAWVALASYNLLQVGLYGIAGVAAQPLAERYLHLSGGWWVWALMAWALTAVMGVADVAVNGVLVSALLLVEVALIVVCSVADLVHPGPQGLTYATLSPSALTGGGWASLTVLALAVLGYVGFESAPVYSEETRQTARTIRTAMYCTLVFSAGVYVLASWALSVAVGPARIVGAEAGDPAQLFFTAAADRLGQVTADLAHILLLTSITAALIAFHNTVARYTYALARERVLPSALSTTWARTKSPVLASLAQSVIGLAVIVAAAACGVDPLQQLFYLCGTAGGIGVLALLLVTALTIVVFFTRIQHREGVWTAFVSPLLAAAALAVILAVALIHLDQLLGVPRHDPLTWIIPLGLLALLAGGTQVGNVLRVRRPDVFAAIGHGSRSSVIRGQAR